MASAAQNLGKLDDSIARPSDVAYYIRHTLEHDDFGISDADTNNIIKCAAGSLVWAVTACRFFLTFSPYDTSQNQSLRRAHIQRVIKSGGGSLPALYTIILDSCFGFATFALMHANVYSCISLWKPIRWGTLSKLHPSLFSPGVFFPLPMISDCRANNPMLSPPHPSFLAFIDRHYRHFNRCCMDSFTPDSVQIREIEEEEEHATLLRKQVAGLE